MNNNIYNNGGYLEKNKMWHVEDSSWKAEIIYNIMLRNNIQSKTICEVGCGAGEILKQLSIRSPSIKFYGYELSPQAFEMCKTRESKNVKYKNENILKETTNFDTLLCIDVFEHVEDYIGFIKALKVKATYKIFHIPIDVSVLSVLRDAQISARYDVGHLHYFTEATALATLVDAGYEIIESKFTTPFRDLPIKSLKEKLAFFPRNIVYWISPKMMVKIFGGCSLIVLAK